MTTMTREEQKQVLIDTANHIINRDNTSPYSENLRELARIALASLEAEPVGAFHIAEQQVDGTSDYLKDGEWPIDNGIIEVYAAPPVPVVPAALPENDDEDGHDIDYLEPSEVYALGRTAGWNSCRAAMLQSGNFRENKNSSTSNFREIAETSTNHPELPDSWISCSERMPDDGQHVIILCDGAFVLYAQYRDGEFFDVVRDGDEFFETQSRNVTDWMPLPEPPQGVNRG
ncbi:TPA: DUF551 domain-containing protein [Escherichia coli]|nr:DUF551 domain-containing protein [Escherichia coli]EFI8189063.1 DUF551 domain-containing protein [Escherichia coli]EGM4556650.1 DUF551 domain-containing protein [Escherichia coli]EKB0463165.1 DUF551 domain-containing protein [Escherichia coli]HBL0297078.1 DUF551 domain-containing protein [Escherichia coli]